MFKNTEKLPLPSSSANEDLETISRNRFSLLFDTKLFELRTENTRDKGVDLFVELKQDGSYTNFRFAVQLKSTMSIKKNTDGSISFPIEVSNINYLLNLSIPGYYILYDHNEEVFYYEKVFFAYQALLKKYDPENIPSQFKVRFSKILTAEMITEIYSDTLQRGNLYRQINPHLEQTGKTKRPSGIVIDQHNEVYNIEQNIAYIEHFGFALINDAAFGTIVEIEQRSHPRKEASAMFNLICGLAYYYKGKVFRALDFLRMADRNKSGFDTVIKSMLSYTLLQAEHEAGILNVKKLKSKTLMLMEGDDIGSFLEIEKAWRELDNPTLPYNEKLHEFYTSIKVVIEREPDNPKARILGYARVVEAEMFSLLNDLGKNLFTAVGTANSKAKESVTVHWAKLEKQFHSRIDTLMDYIGKFNDLQAMANISRLKIEWFYRKEFIHHVYDHWDFSTLRSDGEFTASFKKEFDRHLGFLDQTIELFKTQKQDENMILSLMLKYKILHFLKDNGTKAIETAVEEIFVTNDYARLERKFKKLISKGTDHEIYTVDAIMRLTHIFTLSKKSGIEKYLLQNDQDKDLERESNIEWTIGKLMEFDFPAAAEYYFPVPKSDKL